MKVFISQPMRGLDNDEIIRVRSEAIEKIKEMYKDTDIEVIDSFFKDAPVTAKPLWYLADSLKLMSEADVVVFCKGYETARGCLIEKRCADDYQYNTVVL